MDPYLWLAAESRDEIKTLAEVGEWAEGDGMRVALLTNFLLVTVKTPDRDCEVAIPLSQILTEMALPTLKAN